VKGDLIPTAKLNQRQRVEALLIGFELMLENPLQQCIDRLYRGDVRALVNEIRRLQRKAGEGDRR